MFGLFVRQVRWAAGLTQRDLAEVIEERAAIVTAVLDAADATRR